jgi:hypothetical protein
MYDCGIAALGLPVLNQALCADHHNDPFLTYPTTVSYLLERYQFSMLNS